MGKNVLAGLVLLLVMLNSRTASAYFLDAPHNEANGIYCYTCHTPEWYSYVPSGPDDTLFNHVCLGCHDSDSSAPVMPLHSSGNSATGTYGDWSTECVDCHDPHFQGQLDWQGDARLYLAQGDFANVAAGYDPQDPAGHGFGTTAVGVANLSGRPGWLDTSLWGAKGGYSDPLEAEDGSRGLILVANKANPTDTYEIVSVSGNVLKVKGEMAPINLGQTFGVIYGQAIKSFIFPSWGRSASDYRDVKFFDRNGFIATYGGDVDRTSGELTPVGICQVCHSKTPYWRGTNFVYSPDVYISNHDPGYPCFDCHSFALLVAGNDKLHAEFIFDRLASGCEGCHGGYTSAPDAAHQGGCGTCHTVAPPEINNSMMATEPGMLLMDSLVDGGYFFNPRLVDSNLRDIATPGFLAVDCLECHQSKFVDHTPFSPLNLLGEGDGGGGDSGRTIWK